MPQITESEYRTQTFYALHAFAWCFPIITFLVFSIVFLGRIFQIMLLSVIGPMLVVLLPFLFQKRILKFFTRKAVLNFSSQGFLIQEYSMQNDVFINNISIKWKDIKSYKIYFSESNKTYLTVYLKNNKNKSFSFIDEKNEDEAIREKSVFSILFSFINQYNSNKENDEKIALQPGFLTTKAGTLILYTIVFFVIIAIILHITLQTKTSIAALIMGISSLLGLIGKRASDKRFYKKVRKMEGEFSIE